MRRNGTFGFRINEQERDGINRLADALQRKPADAVRLVVNSAVDALTSQQQATRPDVMGATVKQGEERQ